MKNKYDDSFFDDLDKTTDLLKSFRSHMETDEVTGNFDSLDDIYNSIECETVENQSETVQSIEQEPNEALDIFSKQSVNQIEQNPEQDKKSQIEQIKQSSTKEDTIEISELSMIEDKEDKKEIELSDLFEEVSSKKEEKKKKTSKIKQQKQDKEDKKEKVKFNPFELAFCAFSLLFILGCIGVYGSRFLKYYKIYNPKSSNGQSLLLLSSAIGKDSPLVYEGSGLYMNGGDYVYKGKNVNNYLRYSNFTWRIIKSNVDGTIDLVLDDYINALPWSTTNVEFTKSDVNKYLNEYFAKFLDKEYLTTTTICLDEVSELKNYSCNKFNDEYYVRLLSVNEFLNSKADDTYIADEKSTLWLSTKSSDKAWQVNGTNLSLAESNRSLGIKPVIKLKSSAVLLGGDGTKENPYYIKDEKKELQVGSYVTLGNDTWVIYDMDSDTMSLALNGVLPKQYYFDTTSMVYDPSITTSLAYLLNVKYPELLSYKDLLIEKEWNSGAYQSSYEDVTSTKIKAKVGMLNTMDLKFNSSMGDYFLINNIYGKVGLYGSEAIGSNPVIRQGVRPTICIKKAEIKEGEGSLEKPFKLGV